MKKACKDQYAVQYYDGSLKMWREYHQSNRLGTDIYFGKGLCLHDVYIEAQHTYRYVRVIRKTLVVVEPETIKDVYTGIE